MRPSFIETIRLEDGLPQHLDYHQRRLEATLDRYYPELDKPIKLAELLPNELPSGRAKWRIVYTDQVEDVSVSPYEARVVDSLRIVEAHEIAYPYKGLDRSAIDACYKERQTCSDVLIVRAGLLTDTSIANIALGDGSLWLTPDRPLLPGTTRARLLDEGRLKEAELRPADLSSYPFIALFNALIPFGSLVLPTTCIRG